MSRPDPVPSNADTPGASNAGTLVREAELASGSDATGLWLAAARAFEEAGELDSALEALGSARKVEPGVGLTPLLRVAGALGKWSIAVEALSAERQLAAGDEKVARTVELAVLLAGPAGKPEEALPLLTEALEADPGHPGALAAAVPLWSASGAWSQLVDALAAAADSAAGTGDSGRAAALLYEAAETARWKLHASERAAEMLERAVALDPKSGVAAKALAEVASASRDWRRLALALEREAALSSSPELAAAALVKLGSIREDLLGDHDGAEVAYRAALEKEPANRAALAAFSRVAEAKGDHALRAELLERRLLLATDVREAIAISLALGTLYEESLGSKDRAANHYRRVLAVTADEAPAFRALGRLLASTGDWQGLIDLYEREAKETPDNSHRVHCLFKIAELNEERLAQDLKAISAYRRVLEVAPTYLPALRALGRLFQKNEDWPSLVELFQGEADATTDAGQAAALLERVAALQEEKLADFEAAVRTWERVLKMVPNHLPALRALGRLHHRRERWVDLVNVNLQEAAITKDPRVVASLLHKTGEVYEERLASQEDALSCYRSALDHVPNYLPAMRSMGRLAASLGRWEEVVRTEELEADTTADPRRAASLLASAAEHYESRLQDPEKAIAAYERVIGRVPGYLPAVAGLSRLYRRLGRWAELSRVLEAAMPAMDRDPGAAAALLLEIAGIEGHHLGQDAVAESRVAEARRGAPEDRLSLREHEEYHAKGGFWSDLMETYRVTAEAAPPGELRAALLVRLGDLTRAVGGAGVSDGEAEKKAAGFYHGALAVHPGDRAAAAALERSGRATGDIALQVEALAALAMSAVSLSERRSVLRELAALYAGRGNLTDAESCLAAAVHIAPDAATWEELAVVLTRMGRRPEAADAFEQASRASSEDAERERLTSAAIESLVAAGSLEEAERRALPLVATAPEATPILLVLERIHAAMAARPGLTPEQRASLGGKLADTQRRLAAAARDPARRAELTLKVAATLAGPLGKSSEATGMLEEVAAAEPAGSALQREALARLAEHYGAAGDELRQAGTLERLAEVSPPEAKAALWVHAGEVAREVDPDRAITDWEKALAIDPNQRKAIDGLLAIYQARESWQPLLAVLNGIIKATRDPKQAADAFWRKGVILKERMVLPDKALEHFKRALSADPAHLPAMDSLAAMQAESDKPEEAKDLYRKMYEAAPEDSSERADAAVKLARLERKAGEEARALELLEGVMARFPARTEVHEEILSILEVKADAGPAYIAALRNASLTAGEPRRSSLRRRLAKALDEKAGDPAGAAAEYRALIRGNPEDVELRAALAAILARDKESPAQAILAHAAVVKVAPLRLDSLQWLLHAYESLKHHDKVFCLSGVLSFLEAAEDAQRLFYRAELEKAPRKATVALTPEDRRSMLVHPEARTPVGDLLTKLGLALWGGVAPQLPGGSGRWERLRPGDKHPLRVRFDGLTTLFGTPPLDLMLAKDKSSGVEIAAGEAPLILVGGGLPGLKPAVADFLLARALFRVSVGWIPAARSPGEIKADLWLAAAAIDLTDAPKGADPRRVKSIAKAIPKRLRSELTQALEAFTGRPTSFDVDGFLKGADRSADRAGLLACVELLAAMEALSLVDPALSGSDDPWPMRVARSPSAKDLLAYASSEDLFSLRKKVGLAIV